MSFFPSSAGACTQMKLSFWNLPLILLINRLEINMPCSYAFANNETCSKTMSSWQLQCTVQFSFSCMLLHNHLTSGTANSSVQYDGVTSIKFLCAQLLYRNRTFRVSTKSLILLGSVSVSVRLRSLKASQKLGLFKGGILKPRPTPKLDDQSICVCLSCRP
jgi:hypothetical protein